MNNKIYTAIMYVLLVAIIIIALICGTNSRAEHIELKQSARQEKIHNIANSIRELGISESDVLITRLQELWWDEYERVIEEYNKPIVNEDEVEMLACVIYQEAGGDECTDLCRYYVGDVVLNRINDERFPNTMYEVLTQKRQYGRYYWTGIVWPSRAKNPNEAYAVERSYRIARDLLEGNHSELYGAGYVWQASFKQGKDNIYLCGMYFGR